MLESAHREDYDGGYRLASALCKYREQMPDSTAHVWDDVLLGWARDEPARLWGVALEALARAGGVGVNQKLDAMLRASDRDLEWREYVAHTLIRRGFPSATVRRNVQHAARRMTPMGLANLAALLVLAPELLPASVECIVAAMSSGRHDYVEVNVPPFVHAAANSEFDLLVRLVQQTGAKDHQTGSRLAAMIIEYLARPFVQKRFGADVVGQVADELWCLHLN